MTTEEAIEILQEEHDYCQEPFYVIKALKMAIAALRAQQEAEKNKQLTNANRIRTMSNEELAEHNIHNIKIWNSFKGYHEPAYRCSDKYITDDYSVAFAHELDWLQQPVEENNND